MVRRQVEEGQMAGREARVSGEERGRLAAERGRRRGEEIVETAIEQQQPQTVQQIYTEPKSEMSETEKEIRSTGGWPDRTIWVLDHNHTTKKFRGWICNNCNVAIGRFADSVTSLQKAIKYLKENTNEKS